MAAPTDWITLREASDILAAANIRFTPSTIGGWARAGRLSSIKLGGRRFVRRGEVRALIAAPRRVNPPRIPAALVEDPPLRQEATAAPPTAAGARDRGRRTRARASRRPHAHGHSRGTP